MIISKTPLLRKQSLISRSLIDTKGCNAHNFVKSFDHNVVIISLI